MASDVSPKSAAMAGANLADHEDVEPVDKTDEHADEQSHQLGSANPRPVDKFFDIELVHESGIPHPARLMRRATYPKHQNTVLMGNQHPNMGSGKFARLTVSRGQRVQPGSAAPRCGRNATGFGQSHHFT
jgi:hypothetical protein